MKKEFVRKYELAKRFYSWIETCLIMDELWEELALVKMTLDLELSVEEVMIIRWSQFEFPYVKNIKQLGVRNTSGTKRLEEIGVYGDRTITQNTWDVLFKVETNEVPEVFQKDLYTYFNNISKSIGTKFNEKTLWKMVKVMKKGREEIIFLTGV